MAVRSARAGDRPVAASEGRGRTIASPLDSLVVLLFFVLTRPVLDYFATDDARVAGFSINLAAAWAFAITAYAAGMLVRRRSPTPALAGIWALIVGASGLAALNALRLVPAAKHDAVAELIRILSIAAVYFLASRVADTPKRARLLVVAVALSALAPAIVGVYQLVHGVPTATDLAEGRVSGTFSGPNPFGEYLAVAALFLLFARAGLLRWQLRMVLLAPMLVALAGTYSRTSWILFGIGLVGLLARDRPWTLAAVAIVASVVAVSVPSIRARLTGRDRTVPSTATSVVPESYRWRIDNWRYLAEAYRKEPVTGWGLQTAQIVNPRRTPLTNIGYDPHNTVVRLLVEGGPILLALWVALFRTAWMRMRRASALVSELASAARAASWVLIAVAVCALTSDDMLASTALMYALFVVAAALEGPTVRRELLPSENV